jgi:hypothetical protein
MDIRRAYVRRVIGRQRAKDLLMSAQHKFAGRKLQRVLLATIMSVFALGVAVPAANATLVITPFITGSGELRANGATGTPLCQQGVLLNTTALTCAAPTLLNSNCNIFFCETQSAFLDPTPKPGWRFAGWSGCPSVSGNRCSMASSIFFLTTFNPVATFREIVDTTLVSGPPDFSNSKNATFVYKTTSGLTFTGCQIDATPLTCGTAINRQAQTALTNLADGVHTFRVAGFSANGNPSDTPVVRTWRVDTIAPVVTGLASPTITDGIVTTALNATFTWGVTEAGGLLRFECKLDGGDFEACTSGKSFSDLPFGGRTFSVRGVDRAGNVGPTVTRSWTVAARDEDGDGFNQRSDCNDGDPRINPIAPDVPDNGVDENCDGADAVNLDRDADGFQRPADCDDANPSIKPGVTDIVDNNIDENCDGSDAKSTPPTRIVVSMPFFVKKSTNKFTTFTLLQVKGILQGSLLKVACKAPKKKKCPAGNTFTKRNAGGTVSLAKWLKKKLPAGTTLTVTVTKTGNFIGAVKIMTVKKKARPSFVDRCIKPGATKAGTC